MKHFYILITFCFIATSVLSQKQPESRTKDMVGTYNGKTSDTYSFTNNLNNQEFTFIDIEGDALKNYELADSRFIGLLFQISYRIDFIKNDVKKRDDKLSASQSPFIKTFTIINLKELTGNLDDSNKNEKDDTDDDGGK